MILTLDQVEFQSHKIAEGEDIGSLKGPYKPGLEIVGWIYLKNKRRAFYQILSALYDSSASQITEQHKLKIFNLIQNKVNKFVLKHKSLFLMERPKRF